MGTRVAGPAGVLGFALLAALAGGPATATPPPQAPDKDDDAAEGRLKLAHGDPVFQARVDDAVTRGREALAAKAQKDGSWPREHDQSSGHGPFPHGSTALALLALIKGGYPLGADCVTKGFEFLYERWQNWKAGGRPLAGPSAWHTYEVGLTLMALDALDAWRPKHWKPEKTEVPGGRLRPVWRGWPGELRDFLVEHQAVTRQTAGGGGRAGGAAGLEDHREAWHYPSSDRLQTDHSNTQYAVLGLRSAERLGFPAPTTTWIGVLEGFLATQAADGDPVLRIVADPRKRADGYVDLGTVANRKDRARGWGYAGGERPREPRGQFAQTGSMTTVGIACVAIARHALDGRAKAGDREAAKCLRAREVEAETAAWDGVAWLARNWSVTENPGYGTWHYYYLYGLERAGILTGQPNVGRHDWYREGGDVLLTAQKAGGLWDDGNGDGTTPSTAFALLFLMRATMPLTATTGPPGAGPHRRDVLPCGKPGAR